MWPPPVRLHCHQHHQHQSHLTPQACYFQERNAGVIRSSCFQREYSTLRHKWCDCVDFTVCLINQRLSVVDEVNEMVRLTHRWSSNSKMASVERRERGVRGCKTKIQRAPIWTTSPSQTIFPSNHPFKNSMTEDNLQGETDLRSTGEGSLLQRQGVDF